jgi:hypothetical protein
MRLVYIMLSGNQAKPNCEIGKCKQIAISATEIKRYGGWKWEDPLYS